MNKYRVKNPNGCKVYRREGTNLIALSEWTIPQGDVINTSLMLTSPIGDFVEYHPKGDQDTLQEVYVLLRDLELALV